eukprot:scaffold320162_cov96-Cyclotella_meneghiniana.AAC.2
MIPPTVYANPPPKNNIIPPICIYGNNQNIKKPPIHPIVMYIVMENHLGIRCTPLLIVKNIPRRDKNHATPKKDHPMTVSWRNTRHRGVNVPAINGYIAK